MRWRRVVPVLLVLWLAFVVRVHGLDGVRHEFDRAYPHGLGIAILDAVRDGRLADLPLRSLTSNVRIDNPPLASYLWAAVAVFDPSPYAATFVSVVLGVLGVAMTFDLGRRLFGYAVGLTAALVYAGSPWSAYVARGTWLQGQVEFWAVLAAWAVLLAVVQRNGRRLAAGLVATAVVSQTYLLSLALIVQGAAAVAAGWHRSLARGAVVGLSACAVSLALIAGTSMASRGVSTPALDRSLQTAVAPNPSLPNPWGLVLDPTPFVAAGQVISGQGFDARWTRWSDDLGEREPLSEARAAVVLALVLIGSVVAVRQVRSAGHRLILVWGYLPIASLVVAIIVVKQIYVHPFYLLVTSPAGYLLAGLPVGWMAARLRRSSVAAPYARLGPVLLAAVIVAAMIAPLRSIAAQVQRSRLQPLTSVIDEVGHDFFDRVQTLPLRELMKIGAIWRASCRTMEQAEGRYWAASVMGDARRADDARSAAVRGSDIWAVTNGGGECVSRADGPQPGNSEIVGVVDAGGTPVLTYRSLPFAGAAPGALSGVGGILAPLAAGVFALKDPGSVLDSNIGWRLVDFRSSETAALGGTVEVTQAWQIVTLPEDRAAGWDFRPFVDLVTSDGRVISSADTPSLPGSVWRKGDVLLSTVRVPVPKALEPGSYRIRASLYDPGQGKNAAYFMPQPGGETVLRLERDVTIGP